MKILDTIAAIGTPYGKGGVAIIRISGEDAIAVAEKVFVAASGKALSELEPNKLVWGEIYRNYGDERICIDDGMAVVFRAPRSFTGEDTVEINCHGGILVTRSVLSAVIEAGARMATAGEFTRRAFVNGKMKLTQAEALGYLLDAENENQLLLSRGGMRGILSDKTEAIYKRLVDVMGSVYAKLDFPDEDLNELGRDEIREILTRVYDEIMALSATYKTGRAISKGVPTAICGHTNVGKSSIYNRLVGRDAAIVTDVEGTTRDLLYETVSFGGATLRLCDTAGIRETDDIVENIGISRAKDEIEKCELVFAVFDISEEMTPEDEAFYRELLASGKEIIALYNKADINVEKNKPSELFERYVYVSAKTGEGFDELENMVGDMFIDGNISLYSDAVVMDERQYSSLIRSAESISHAIASIDASLELDICSVDIEMAMSELSELDGREVGEDIVSNIFSRFCVGK